MPCQLRLFTFFTYSRCFMDATEYLSNMPDEILVAVNLNTVAGDVIKQNGMAVNEEPPSLEVRFGPDFVIDAGEIDFSADCLVFIETGEIVTLICSVAEIPAPNQLFLTVRDIIQHVEKREYFRSPADRLSVCGYRKGESPKNRRVFSAKGMNVSSGGMLVLINEKVEKKERLVFEIELPEPVKKTLTAEATVLRIEKTQEGASRVAVMFENSAEIGDDIMGYCFAEQRRMLREQVLTKDML